MTSTKSANDSKVITSLLCGGIAGILDMAITYPTEYIKTQMQLPQRRARQTVSPTPASGSTHSLSMRTPLQSATGTFKYNTAAALTAPAPKVTPISILFNTIKSKGPQALWTGVWPALYGNAMKAGVRFMFYDKLTVFFGKTKTVEASAAGTVAAGFLAGAGEAMIVLQPLEGIRTKLIDDSNARNPRFRGSFMRAAVIIPREEGIRGIYRGWAPCAVRQGSSTAVRFVTYELQKRWWKKTTGEDAGGMARFAMGGVAGATTVYTTMPLDVLKTKMQSLSSHRYKSSFDCLKQTVRDEGMKGLWKGATPRLGRLIFSGGITFGTYEWLYSMVNPAVVAFTV